MGTIKINPAHFSWDEIANNPFYCPDPNQVTAMADLITHLRKAGDSTGARINVQVDKMPIGLGEPVFDRLDADLAKALMSINAVKGVEIGAGFACIEQLGSEHRDEITANGFVTNHAGGILAGISTGQSLTMSVAFKPTSSIVTPARSIDEQGNEVMVSTTGRHDPCVGIRGVAVCEAMVALVLMDHWLHFKHV
jgi:chorismate synthase